MTVGELFAFWFQENNFDTNFAILLSKILSFRMLFPFIHPSRVSDKNAQHLHKTRQIFSNFSPKIVQT